MESASKNFRKRNAILLYLMETDAHPSAETIYTDLKAQIPDLSMATVYRNLNRFRAENKVCCVATVRGTERFDANTAPHVHFVCSHCDAVIDLEEMQVPDSLSNTAAECVGGRVENCLLTFTGLCKACVQIQEKGGETA